MPTMTEPELETKAAPTTLVPNEPADRALFAERFDHLPFQFRHHLHLHPAFQLPALLAAAERINANPAQAKKQHFESGAPNKDSWFGQRPEGATLVDALASIQNGQNWVILKRIHEDAVYAQVLEEMIPQLSELAAVDIARVYYDPTMTIFVTSPGRITPYHMDGETNFLAQIHGTKLVYIYNGDDTNVLSPEQMEQYWTGALPRIEVPAGLPEGHWQHTLAPGNGVFNPAIFPHWLQNGPEVSVSVSINFKRRNNATIGAYRTNRYLRKAGLTPTAPGKNGTLDRAKEATFGRLYQTAFDARDVLKSKLGK
jgi:hypothetical protein